MLLGIDGGGTALKAVVFDDHGAELGSASRPTRVIISSPGWAERDAAETRDQMFEVICGAMAAAGATGADIAAVGVAGHGDGLYFVGPDGEPSRLAILSVDARAATELEAMRNCGVVDAAVAQTGQQIFGASLAPLARWILGHEPETIAATRWLLACKDWLRLCLTGEIATDYADGAACVGSIDGRAYSEAAIATYGLERLAPLLPPLRGATDVAGTVLPAIAERTGLRIGTPVVVGTHDAVAGVLGLGAGAGGRFSAVAGTYSMNHLVTPERVFGQRMQARPWVEPDHWVLMTGSPASAANFEWYLRSQMAELDDPLAVANAEVAKAMTEESQLIFHPFVYGGPDGQTAGNLLGLQGWHSRRHVLRAIWEGVVFNHGTHLDDLRADRPLTSLRLGGGAARSAVWAQLFANGLDCTVEVTASSEPGALGAAMLAGVGTGLYPSATIAAERCVQVAATYHPDDDAKPKWREARARYAQSVAALRAFTR